MTIAVYPGTFDPVTNGHIDIAIRAAAIFDHLIVAVYARPLKNLLFSTAERLQMLEEALKHIPNISVDSYDILTVEYVRQQGAQFIVRGLRLLSDFEREFQMALTNRERAPNIDTVCLITSLEHSFLSASLVKEIAMLGGDVRGMVPAHVAHALAKKLESLGGEEGEKIAIVSLGDD